MKLFKLTSRLNQLVETRLTYNISKRLVSLNSKKSFWKSAQNATDRTKRTKDKCRTHIFIPANPQSTIKQLLQKSGDVKISLHCKMSFSTMPEYSPKITEGLPNVPDIDNSVREPLQLPTTYCAIWLVDFWPITILVKYVSTREQRNPLLVLFSF